LRDAKGNEITSNDDARGPDSRIEWTCPGDGDYLIDVADLHRRGGDDFTYLLKAHVGGPEFCLRFDEDKIELGTVNHGPWDIAVERKFGFNGTINVEVKGLPPGVTAAPLAIPPNCQHGCLILTAAPDAKVGVGEVEVIGTAESTGADGKPLTINHRAVPMS